MARPKAGSISQMDMVRAALQELGPGAKLQAIQDHIKTTHGKELSKSIISNYKSNMKRKGELKGARRGRKPGPVAAAGKTGGSVRLDDLEVVRGLVSRLGADQLKRLVAVLG
jgi:hypothetical protein